MWTVTSGVSLAVPLKDGVALLESASGCSSVTVGGFVSTSNVTGALQQRHPLVHRHGF